jgi:hypothetical protein
MAVTPSDCSIENFVMGRKLRSFPTKRNVRAVQRGDEGQGLGGRHHAGEESADGMGNGVMHVQQIEAFRIGHLHHFHG